MQNDFFNVLTPCIIIMISALMHFNAKNAFNKTYNNVASVLKDRRNVAALSVF